MAYMNVWTSVAAYVNQQIQMIAANGITPLESMQMFDWEAHANIEEAPALHLIGPASLAIDELSNGIYSATFVIGVGSFKDDGLFVHRKMVDFLFKSLKSGTRLSVFDSTTEQPYSWLKIVDGTSVAPMTKANTRALQFIQAEALVDPMA
ncbi:hypothetical protein [Mesorhizobium sp. M7A.F.Ca.MR.362.00.0.0]|uniref:hypothetical protein n=1 Tax=Mesorhizobium sp. M7A.F.Ca.MR.362.00.0.0 TaxID=2496779 RepID=UPI000FD2DDC3|nr:hypothetical protein [Mesorhizobium sp. M7A.F.Ca.MR.362.00.0.0]RUU78135.1 hypothetical protein EOC06_20995 [Mesorhizobium sp. M7A.F.Ca.MR.362.00.0.0]RWN95447.1 MAG: hypothetical protein EOS05_11680 [Mesorhizobium sp.]